jgi:hypothetical protein
MAPKKPTPKKPTPKKPLAPKPQAAANHPCKNLWVHKGRGHLKNPLPDMICQSCVEAGLLGPPVSSQAAPGPSLLAPVQTSPYSSILAPPQPPNPHQLPPLQPFSYPTTLAPILAPAPTLSQQSHPPSGPGLGGHGQAEGPGHRGGSMLGYAPPSGWTQPDPETPGGFQHFSPTPSTYAQSSVPAATPASSQTKADLGSNTKCLNCIGYDLDCDGGDPCGSCQSQAVECLRNGKELTHVEFSPNTCDNCKRTKLHCNKALPICERCAQGNLTCYYDPTTYGKNPGERKRRKLK